MMQELQTSTELENSFLNSNKEEWEENILYLYNFYPKLEDKSYCQKIIKNYLNHIQNS